MADGAQSELGQESGREGRRSAPPPGSRCSPAACRPATRPGSPGVSHATPGPHGRARPHERAVVARSRLPTALPGPRRSPASAAGRAGGRLRARPAGAPPRADEAPPRPPRGGLLTSGGRGGSRPDVACLGATRWRARRLVSLPGGGWSAPGADSCGHRAAGRSRVRSPPGRLAPRRHPSHSQTRRDLWGHWDTGLDVS